jgi:hypothetical protein
MKMIPSVPGGHCLLAVLLIGLLTAPAVLAGEEGKEEKKAEAENLIEALTKGSVSLNLRYRYEEVADDLVPGRDAHASTLRTALGYRTLPWFGVSAFLEAENVTVIGNDLYNNKGAGSLWNGVDDRPVVADVALTEINQVYLDVCSLKDTIFRAGRDEILLDNQRFVGNVGWRQNHQSFDALSIGNESIPHTRLTYIYMANVNRIFGDNKRMNSSLFNGNYSGCPYADFTLYYYYLDYDRDLDFGASTGTFGGRLNGDWNADENWKINYDFEYATQGDVAENPYEIDADYYHLQAGFGYTKAFSFTLGYEVLGGSPGLGSFSTPLATLHKFNGWADRFLVTPEDGLADTYVALGSKLGAFTLKGAYHWFKADEGGYNYGNEVDLLASWKSSWKQVFAIKAAIYDADTWSQDVTKIWFFTSWGF